MIIQRLVDYYNRKSEYQQGETDVSVGNKIAPDGFEWKEIQWVIVLASDGSVVNLEDTREGKRAKTFLIPKAMIRSNQIKPNWFWDNPMYVLGLAKENAKLDRVQKCHESFCDQINHIDTEDVGINAVKLFLNNPNKIEQLEMLGDVWVAFKQNLGVNIIFQLAEEDTPIPEYSIMCGILNLESSEPSPGVCMVRGVETEVVRLHSPIKGVKGTKTGGTPLISYQSDSTHSQGKWRGANCTVGAETEGAYTRALNMLLNRDSKQKIQVGDMTLVFWSGVADSMENHFVNFFSFQRKDNPDALTEAVRHLYRTLEVGDSNLDNKFYVLGLVGEQGRISIRLWLEDTVGGLSAKIKKHYDDTALVGVNPQPCMKLLRGITRDLKESVPSAIVSSFLNAILTGQSYPRELYSAAIVRNRVERSIPVSRLAIIKGYLIRKGIHVTMELDKETENVGYLLGRLFSVLERVQEKGMGYTDLQSRYYQSASSVPQIIFPRLISRSMYHRTKLEKGYQVYVDKLQQEIMGKLDSFPTHLSLENQGLFALGYSHQRSDFFTKKEEVNK
jgi:CRISPR-associated protein Csd1